MRRIKLVSLAGVLLAASPAWATDYTWAPISCLATPPANRRPRRDTDGFWNGPWDCNVDCAPLACGQGWVASGSSSPGSGFPGSGDSATIGGNVIITSLEQTVQSLTLYGNITFENPSSGPAGITVADGGTFSVGVGQSTYVVMPGEFGLYYITLSPGVTGVIGGGMSFGGNTFTNLGNLTWNGGAIYAPGGDLPYGFYNEGTFTILADAVTGVLTEPPHGGGNGIGGSYTIVNTGTINIVGPGEVTAGDQWNLDNYGLIQFIDGGVLELSGNATHTLETGRVAGKRGSAGRHRIDHSPRRHHQPREGDHAHPGRWWIRPGEWNPQRQWDV